MTAKAFASAGLFALVFEGLRRQGIAPPEPPPCPGLRHVAPPVVPLGRKRGLLSGVMEGHGPLALLRVGEAVEEFGFHPMLHALLRARGPVDLIGRWLRLERYAHSNHRTVVEWIEENATHLRHIAIEGPAPSVAEDLLVLGVYVGLLRAIGVRDITAAIAGVTVLHACGGWDEAGVGQALATGATADWCLGWSGWEARGPLRAASPALPAIPFTEFGNCDAAAALAALYAEDPARHLTLREAARALELSPRGLQRRLAAAGLTTTSVVRAVQVHQACLLLAGTEEPLPAIGYACGFSDQAHFTRAFRQRVNMTPGAYRNLVRARPS